MDLDVSKLNEILDEMLEKNENEVAEYKEAKNDFSKEEIGKYFSAISNEANLNGLQYGWLIFGIEDKTNETIGTNYQPDDNFNKIKKYIYEQSNGLSFISINSIKKNNNRIVMFQIPAAEQQATSFKKIFYGREGESVFPLSEEKRERIRYNSRTDWSRQIIKGATIDNLDEEAIAFAKSQYIKKNSTNVKLIEEISVLDGVNLLNKMYLMLDGKVTNATMLLLGKAEFIHFFGDKVPRITWILENDRGEKIDYEHFTIPFILSVDKLYKKIRNLKYRYMPNDETVYTEEEFMYDPQSLREIINNCIVHQDYAFSRMIYVTETEDKIIFRNEGNFIPGEINKVLEVGYTPPYYRNRFLATAMVNVNLIDTIGSGIRRVFSQQQKRFLPLPDYDLCEKNRIKVILYGKVLNKKYSKLLFNNKNLSLNHVLLLDKVQKGYKLTDKEYYELVSKKLIEGPKTRPYFTGQVSQEINEEKSKVVYDGVDDIYYEGVIIKLIKNNRSISRAEIDASLLGFMPDGMTIVQKRNKIHNLLKKLSANGKIKNDSKSTRYPKWIINKTGVIGNNPHESAKNL